MDVIKYFFKRILLFCSPFLIIFLIYIVTDPFRIIYEYDDYYKNSIININRDFVSSEVYLKNSKEYVYDSFIFSGSEAFFLPPSLWRKYIVTSNEVFSFDAYQENILGIWSKIKYIHGNNQRIKNALLVFDTSVTFGKFNNEGHVFMKHYEIYPSSKFKFHNTSFLSFLRPKFLIPLIHYKITGEFYPYMDEVLAHGYSSKDLVSNEVSLEGSIKELKTDSLGYYKKREQLFQSRLEKRNGKVLEEVQQIDENTIQILQEINNIFIADSTDFRILITPKYTQIAFNENDLHVLREIFGEKHVYDFSGINSYTEDMSNFYDPGHFKTYIGAELMDEIYR